MNAEIEKKLKEYPISFEQIVKCVFNVRDLCNEYYNETKHDQRFYVAIRSTAFGEKFEKLLIDELNALGILKFIVGNPNTQEDCYCPDNPDNSIEIKTSLSGTFYNSAKDPDNHKTVNPTKYKDPNRRVFYILIERDIEKYNTNSYKTIIKRIYFGMLCLYDYTYNSNNASLSAFDRDYCCKKIYDYKNKY